MESLCNDLKRLIETSSITYADESFCVEVKGKTYRVDFTVEEQVEPSKGRFENLTQMLHYLRQHPGDWIPADDSGSFLKGYVTLDEKKPDHVTVPFSAFKEHLPDHLRRYLVEFDTACRKRAQELGRTK